MAIAAVLTMALAGCGEPQPPAEKPGAAPGSKASRLPNGAEAQSLRLVIFLGDSLTAGYGISEAQAFPSLVEANLRGLGLPVRIVNAGVSGDTTAGGVSRLDWLLAQEPAVVVVELGANDGLRGLSLADSEVNLDEIVRRTLDSGAAVLLAGMKIPPSYGPEYSAEFEELFTRLSRRHEVPLIPFLLAGVAARPELNLPDGIHPNPQGHAAVAETVTAHLVELLRGP